MKLAFSTLGCPDWTLEEILQKGHAMGFQGVEVRGIAGVMDNNKIPAFSDEQIPHTKALFEKYGMTLCGINTSVSFDYAPDLATALQEGMDAIDLCVKLGCDNIRVFGDSISPEDPEHSIRQVVDGLRILCDYALPRGVKVCLEIHGQFNTKEVVSRVVREVDSPAFGLIFDMEHVVLGVGRDFYAFYHEVKPYIHRIHVKDYIHKPGGGVLAVNLNEGEVPVFAMVRALEKDCYNGFYSFEWEKKWMPEIAPPEEAFPLYVEKMKKMEVLCRE